VLKEEIDRLEAEIQKWKPRTVPLTQRLDTLFEAEESRQAERDKLLAEWPGLEYREKGEALRRLFSSVTLFWDKVFHPSMSNPPRTRPRKTNRNGLYSYPLRMDRIKWGSSD